MTNNLLSMALLTVAVALHAQIPQPAQTSQAGTGLTGKDFALKVAEANQKEIELARMAGSKAQSPQVKSYAEQLVRDHTKSLEEIKKYAAKHNIRFPNSSSTSSATATSSTNTNSNNTAQPRTENRSNSTSQSAKQPPVGISKPEAMAATDEAHMRDLSSKSGADFDQAYVRLMIVNHEKAVFMFEQQRDNRETDAELRGFVNNSLPTLRTHLSRARSLEKTVMNTRPNATPNATRPRGANNPGANNPTTTPQK